MMPPRLRRAARPSFVQVGVVCCIFAMMGALWLVVSADRSSREAEVHSHIDRLGREFVLGVDLEPSAAFPSGPTVLEHACPEAVISARSRAVVAGFICPASEDRSDPAFREALFTSKFNAPLTRCIARGEAPSETPLDWWREARERRGGFLEGDHDVFYRLVRVDCGSQAATHMDIVARRGDKGRWVWGRIAAPSPGDWVTLWPSDAVAPKSWWDVDGPAGVRVARLAPRALLAPPDWNVPFLLEVAIAIGLTITIAAPFLLRGHRLLRKSKRELEEKVVELNAVSKVLEARIAAAEARVATALHFVDAARDVFLLEVHGGEERIAEELRPGVEKVLGDVRAIDTPEIEQQALNVFRRVFLGFGQRFLARWRDDLRARRAERADVCEQLVAAAWKSVYCERALAAKLAGRDVSNLACPNYECAADEHAARILREDALVRAAVENVLRNALNAGLRSDRATPVKITCRLEDGRRLVVTVENAATPDEVRRAEEASAVANRFIEGEEFQGQYFGSCMNAILAEDYGIRVRIEARDGVMVTVIEKDVVPTEVKR
jgi:hypothetical protein